VFDAEIVGVDEASDVALIRVTNNPGYLPEIPLGDEAGLRPGEIVLVVGSPFGHRQSVTQGIVSAIGRGRVGIADYEYHIQTDAPINPGNSGGPLVNLSGEVVGINTAIATGSRSSAGVGFAIPVSMARKIAEQLLEFGEVRRGMIGVGIQDVTAESALSMGAPRLGGALVGQVFEDSPGEKAGLQTGDIILSIDGREIRDVAQLRNTVSLTPAGSEIELSVWREGRELNMPLTIAPLNFGDDDDEAPARRSSSDKEDENMGELGLGVQTLDSDVATALGLDADARGVVVTQVDRNSFAARAGLETGMAILAVGRQDIENVRDFRQAIERLMDNDAPSALLLVRDENGQRFLPLRLK
jgi:serine protease Do